MTWHIHQLIDLSTAEIKPYQPGDQVHEITNAINAARLALARERLTSIKPTRTIASDGGASLADELFSPEVIG